MCPHQASNITHFARAWNVDFITLDGRVTASAALMVTAISALRDLYEAGAFPRNFPTLLQEEASTWIQSGRAAMLITNMSRHPQLNTVESSSFAGKIKAANLPVSETPHGALKIAPVGIRIWTLVLPPNATEKVLYRLEGRRKGTE